MKKWNEINQDPNNKDVLNYRLNYLLQSQDPRLISNRIEYLSKLVKNKSVLDVGCVAHTSEAEQETQWLHKHLTQNSSYCLGVDILEEEVNSLSQLGYNVVCQDLIVNPVTEKFDIVICGEVIEHLDNVGDFIASIVNSLNRKGRLIVTVPNPWYINVVIKSIISKSPYVDNADHVGWFDSCTLLEIASRHNLILDKFTGIKIGQAQTLKSKILFALAPLLVFLGVKSHFFAKTMLYEFILDEENIVD